MRIFHLAILINNNNNFLRFGFCHHRRRHYSFNEFIINLCRFEWQQHNINKINIYYYWTYFTIFQMDFYVICICCFVLLLEPLSIWFFVPTEIPKPISCVWHSASFYIYRFYCAHFLCLFLFHFHRSLNFVIYINLNIHHVTVKMVFCVMVLVRVRNAYNARFDYTRDNSEKTK